MEKLTARDRLARAAFDLFNERGYEQTTVDDIAERAGLGRATFFRHYRSKEDVIFPDHERLLDRVRDRLRSTAVSGTCLTQTTMSISNSRWYSVPFGWYAVPIGSASGTGQRKRVMRSSDEQAISA